jgi:hypothetical protein
LAALLTEAGPAASSAATRVPPANNADWVREALGHYNQTIERLKSGDWAGFGMELDAVRAALERASR